MMAIILEDSGAISQVSIVENLKYRILDSRVEGEIVVLPSRRIPVTRMKVTVLLLDNRMTITGGTMIEVMMIPESSRTISKVNVMRFARLARGGDHQ